MVKYIYVAGPLTRGDQALNIRNSIDAARLLQKNGFVPFVPHLYFLWHIIEPDTYEQWMSLCLQWLARCDALLRLPGESTGADREVEEAHQRCMPVYGNGSKTLYGAYEDLVKHVEDLKKLNQGV